MSYKVAYNCQHKFVANPPGFSGCAVDRPWVEVTARLGPHRHRVWCLLDTGADDTILDLGTAAVLGIRAAELPQSQVQTAGGHTVSFGVHNGIDLSFAGVTVNTTVLFGVVAVALLGRSALLGSPAHFAAGFEPSVWSHT